MNNAKTKLFQSGIIKCKAEGRFVYRCSEFKYQSAGFPGAEPWTTLSVSMLVSLCACRNANPESLSAHIVDIGTKTVTTVKPWGETRRSLSARAQSCDICLYCFTAL